MERSREYARVLLRKAREDAWMLEHMVGDSGAPAWGLGFHAQQATEKAIKAVLCHSGVDFPPTHNLKALLLLVREVGADAPPDAAELPRLTPYGAVLRYDEPVTAGQAPQIDRSWAVEAVVRTIAWAEEILGPEEPHP